MNKIKTPWFKDGKDSMSKNAKIRNSRYYHVRNQLRIENDLLVKTGHLVTSPSLVEVCYGENALIGPFWMQKTLLTHKRAILLA